MTAHVMCLTSSGGIPLFVRKNGDKDIMTFSTIASLNGIYMFLKTQSIELLTTDIQDTTIVWKEFKGCIILIAIASGISKQVIYKFLDSVFNAMILIVSLKDIKQPRSIERLKKDLRSCYHIIDKLLEYLDISQKTGIKTDFLDLTDSIICSENHILQICLQGYMDCLDSLYGCVLIHNRLAVATENWWLLDSSERNLLILAIKTNNYCTSKDIPIYLPYKSPNLAHRLVNITLVSNIQVLALCGSNPNLNEIEKLAFQCWRNNIEVLHISEQCYLPNFPNTIALDSRILGFLLVDIKIKKFVISKNVYFKNHISRTHRLDTLKTFYHCTVDMLLCSDSNIENENKSFKKTIEQFKGAKETYWSFEYHKCHALKKFDNILCILYTSTVPIHTMRLLTQKTLKIILSDKQICW